MKLRGYAYFIFGLLATVVFVTEANKCSSCYPIKSIPPCPPTSTYKSAPIISKVSKNPPAITKPVVVKVEQKEIKTVPTSPVKPEVPAEKPKQPETKPAEVKPAEIKPETPQPTEQKNGGQVFSVESLQELNKYIQEHNKVIIDIYASWCGPCKKFTPIYEEFAQKHPDIICLKVDGEKVPAVKNKYNVTGYPTFVLYKNKQQVERFSSASQSLARFEERVKVLL